MACAQRADDRAWWLLPQDAFGKHYPCLEQIAGEELHGRPHLNRLCVDVQLTVGRGVLHEQQEAIEPI